MAYLELSKKYIDKYYNGNKILYMSKYYVIKTTKNGIEYKKNKCLDTWSKNKNECWQFSKQGAEQIAKRLNGNIKKPFWQDGVHYNILEVKK